MRLLFCKYFDTTLRASRLQCRGNGRVDAADESSACCCDCEALRPDVSLLKKVRYPIYTRDATHNTQQAPPRKSRFCSLQNHAAHKCLHSSSRHFHTTVLKQQWDASDLLHRARANWIYTSTPKQQPQCLSQLVTELPSDVQTNRRRHSAYSATPQRINTRHLNRPSLESREVREVIQAVHGHAQRSSLRNKVNVRNAARVTLMVHWLHFYDARAPE